MEDQQLLTPGELAKVLNVPKSRIYSFSRQRGPGSIPIIRVGRYTRYSLQAVLSWLQQQGCNDEAAS